VAAGTHARRVGPGWLLAVATAIVLLGLAILPFLTPAYVRLEQDRVGAAQLTGYTPAQLDLVSGALLGDLVLWQGDFGVSVDGAPVLNERERGHMRDVRSVFAGFFVVVALSAIVLVVAFRRMTGADPRAAVWRAIASGARILAVLIVVAGALVVVAFDAAFELFHRLLFSGCTYTFDPATERLVQLFPEAFWSETAIAVGAVAFAAAVVTALFARRRGLGPVTVASFAPSGSGT